MQLESIVLLPQLLSPLPRIISQGPGQGMPQLPGANSIPSAAPGWRAGWLLLHGQRRGGRGWEKRHISLPDPYQPGAGVNLAAPRGHFPSSDSPRLCSSLASLICLLHLLAPPTGRKWHVPNPAAGNPCYRARKHLAASLFREKATKEKKSMEKAQNKAIWNASTPKFSEVFLASSFELKETAVQTPAAEETGGGSQHPHIFIALFLKLP